MFGVSAGCPVIGSEASCISEREAVRWFGGEVKPDNSIQCAGPGHSKDDRSMRIWFGPRYPDGFRVHSFVDDPMMCRDYVRQVLGLEPWRPGRWASRKPQHAREVRRPQV